MADITKVSTKGQIVIPRELREQLGLEEGDGLQIEKVGELLVLKKIQLESLEKALRGGKK